MKRKTKKKREKTKQTMNKMLPTTARSQNHGRGVPPRKKKRASRHYGHTVMPHGPWCTTTARGLGF